MTPTETKAYTARAAYMRAWQDARRARGLCVACGEPAEPGKSLGRRCLARRRKRERARAVREHDRPTRRRMWLNVDWSRPTAEIARLMDVSESAVRKKRIAAGVRLGRGGRRTKATNTRR